MWYLVKGSGQNGRNYDCPLGCLTQGGNYVRHERGLRLSIPPDLGKRSDEVIVNIEPFDQERRAQVLDGNVGVLGAFKDAVGFKFFNFML